MRLTIKKTMKHWKVLLMLVALSLVSCHDSEPEYADPEVHEKTEKLREQYAPLIVGTWHLEIIGDKMRCFERLTFQPDATLTGMRKMQKRTLVTLNGQQHYTDWEDVEQMNGSFTGNWRMQWERANNGEGNNVMILYAKYDDSSVNALAYSIIGLFGDANETALRFQGFIQDADGWTVYQRGEAEPSF